MITKLASLIIIKIISVSLFGLDQEQEAAKALARAIEQYQEARQAEEILYQAQEPTLATVDTGKVPLLEMYSSLKKSHTIDASQYDSQKHIQTDQEAPVHADAQNISQTDQVAPDDQGQSLTRVLQNHGYIFIKNNSLFTFFIGIYDVFKQNIIGDECRVGSLLKTSLHQDQLTNVLRKIVKNSKAHICLGISYGEEKESWKSTYYQGKWAGVTLDVASMLELFNYIQEYHDLIVNIIITNEHIAFIFENTQDSKTITFS